MEQKTKSFSYLKYQNNWLYGQKANKNLSIAAGDYRDQEDGSLRQYRLFASAIAVNFLFVGTCESRSPRLS
jgi:hypothetical protein